jgi:hypothetical protein
MRKKIDSGSSAFNLHELQCQLSDTKLKIALLQAARLEDEAEEQPDAMALAEPNENTLAAIRRESRRMEKLSLLHRMPPVLRAAAAILLISFLTLSTAMAVSPAVRVAVMKLLYTVTPQHTEIRLVQDEDSAVEVPEGWQGAYYPAYIPEGYTFNSFQGTESMIDALYFLGDNDYMMFSENDANVEANIDAEGYAFSEVDLNGQMALLAQKKGKSTVVWRQENKLMMLTITEDANTAMNIARSVTRIK